MPRTERGGSTPWPAVTSGSTLNCNMVHEPEFPSREWELRTDVKRRGRVGVDPGVAGQREALVAPVDLAGRQWSERTSGLKWRSSSTIAKSRRGSGGLRLWSQKEGRVPCTRRAKVCDMYRETTTRQTTRGPKLHTINSLLYYRVLSYVVFSELWLLLKSFSIILIPSFTFLHW
jgi:hypothetical protein